MRQHLPRVAASVHVAGKFIVFELQGGTNPRSAIAYIWHAICWAVIEPSASSNFLLEPDTLRPPGFVAKVTPLLTSLCTRELSVYVRVIRGGEAPGLLLISTRVCKTTGDCVNCDCALIPPCTPKKRRMSLDLHIAKLFATPSSLFTIAAIYDSEAFKFTRSVSLRPRLRQPMARAVGLGSPRQQAGGTCLACSVLQWCMAHRFLQQ